MPTAISRITVFLVIATLLFVQMSPDLLAQAPPTPTPQQLDQLLAPIALYPDSLLAQITTASTNPQEILDVDNWLANNPGLSDTALSDAAQQQGFDPAFVALTHFPMVLQMMAEHIDDYAAIGQAVSTDHNNGSNNGRPGQPNQPGVNRPQQPRPPTSSRPQQPPAAQRPHSNAAESTELSTFATVATLAPSPADKAPCAAASDATQQPATSTLWSESTGETTHELFQPARKASAASQATSATT